MESTVVISRTDLARRTRRALDMVRGGQPVIVTDRGDEEAVLLDIFDYRLLQAVAAYRAGAALQQGGSTPRGLSAEEVREAIANARGDVQAAWNRVVAAYLDGDISLGRMADLLGLSRFVLLERINRLGLPVMSGPLTPEKLASEIAALDA